MVEWLGDGGQRGETEGHLTVVNYLGRGSLAASASTFGTDMDHSPSNIYRTAYRKTLTGTHFGGIAVAKPQGGGRYKTLLSAELSLREVHPLELGSLRDARLAKVNFTGKIVLAPLDVSSTAIADAVFASITPIMTAIISAEDSSITCGY